MKVPLLADIILRFTDPNNPWFFQFMTDCSTIPEIIWLTQLFGKEVHYHLFKITQSGDRERIRLRVDGNLSDTVHLNAAGTAKVFRNLLNGLKSV